MRAIRTLGRHLRNGFLNLFRNAWMTIASVLTMTLTLTMVGGLIFLMINVDNIATDIEEGVKIRTHIDLVAEPEDEKRLEEQIANIKHVTKIDYSSKENEYQLLVEQYGDEFELFDGDNNPFYNVFIVSVSDPQYLEEVAAQIRELPFVIDGNYGEETTADLVKVLNISRAVVAAIAAVLIVIAVLLISNTIRLTIDARANEIEIMRLVGAKNSFIKAPLMFEGAFIGVIGACIATIMVFALYQGLQSATLQLFGLSILKFAPVFPTLIYVAVGLLVGGVILGMIGANRSAKQHLMI